MGLPVKQEKSKALNLRGDNLYLGPLLVHQHHQRKQVSATLWTSPPRVSWNHCQIINLLTQVDFVHIRTIEDEWESTKEICMTHFSLFPMDQGTSLSPIHSSTTAQISFNCLRYISKQERLLEIMRSTCEILCNQHGRKGRKISKDLHIGAAYIYVLFVRRHQRRPNLSCYMRQLYLKRYRILEMLPCPRKNLCNSPSPRD